MIERSVPRRESGEAPLSLAVPAYFHPAVAPRAWKHLISLAPHLRFVVVNPHNGPGEELDPSYPPVIAELKAAGIRTLGYVDTDYGRRTADDVGREVDTYRQRYGIEGVFLDQVSSGFDQLDHYAQSVVAARTRGARFVVLNPGTHPHPGYIDLANVTVTFEGTWPQYKAISVPDWVQSFPTSRFCHLVHSLPRAAYSDALTLAAQRHVRSVFLTDSRGANPWDHLPGPLASAIERGHWGAA